MPLFSPPIGVLYAAPRAGQSVTLTQVLFPGTISNLPPHQVHNLTFDCSTNQLDVHVQIAGTVEVIRNNILQFNDVVLSLRVTLATQPTFVVAILSATTQFFSMETFVAARFDFATGKIAIKGMPSTTNPPLTLQNALQAVSGSSLSVPAGLGTLSQVTINGVEESDVITIAIKGTIASTDTVAVIFQKSSSGTSAAVIADIKNFNLGRLIQTALSVDIIALPLFGQLQIPEIGFSAALSDITSSLITTLYAPSSRLAGFGSTLPKGVSAHFTATLAGASVDASFSLNKLTFAVPQAAQLSVRQLLDQIPTLATTINTLPTVVTNVLNTQLSEMNFDPVTKQLDIALTLPELAILPSLKLTAVNFMLSVVIDPLSITTLKFTGTWTIQGVGLATTLDYDGVNKVMKVMAIPPNTQTPLQIDTLMKNVVGFQGTLPSSLTSVSLTGIVGNIYNNGNYFIAMSGTVSAGKAYLIFYKGPDGVKVAAAASLQSFPLSSLFQSVGVDITGVPYFGNLIIPSMALVVASGSITSTAFPNFFGPNSPLNVYGNTLPAGLSSQFNIDVAAAKGAVARFSGGSLGFKLPANVKLDIAALASVIPGISGVVNLLPEQLKDTLGGASVDAFSFNGTTKTLSITASLATLHVASGFFSISQVTVHFEATFGQTLTLNMLDFIGTWSVGNDPGAFMIMTSVMYDKASSELMVVGRSIGQDLNIANLVQSLVQTKIQLPAGISSFTITGLAGKTSAEEFVVALNGQVGGATGKISAVFYRTTSGQVGAIVVDITNFMLSKFISSATGVDISTVPYFGQLAIPELKFAVATGDINTPLLAQVSTTGSALESFKTGIVKGASGRFVLQLGQSKVAAEFVGKALDFKVPTASSLVLKDLLTVMPPIQTIITAVPAQLASILDAQISDFAFDTSTLQMRFSGSLQTPIEIIPQFLSLSNVRITLIADLGKKQIDAIVFMGDWNLGQLTIAAGVRYDRATDTLVISGEVNPATSGVTIPNLITSLGGPSMPVPQILSSVKLSMITGNKIGGVTLISLSGTVGSGSMFFFFQKSPSGTAVALAVDIPSFRFTDLVNSATGADISGVPFFSTLNIPQIGLSIASTELNNPLLSSIFPPSSLLAEFGAVIPTGVTASFSIDIATAKGLIADFASGKLNLQVPNGIDLSLDTLLGQIPELNTMISSLPQPIQQIGSTKLSKLMFAPTTREFQLAGSLASLTIVPNLLGLSNIQFDFSVIIGNGAQVQFVKFKGTWDFNSLSVTTEVFYDKNILLISGTPAPGSTLNVGQFIKRLANIDLNVPPVLDALKFTQVVGKIQNGVLSLVLLGEVTGKAHISVVFEDSQAGKIVAFAADVQQFKLSELVLSGTGVDITGVPFFGSFVVPALSFVVSSKQLSTSGLPDLSGVSFPVPKELTLPTIPAGVAGKFLADIGSAVGLDASFADGVLTIIVPPETTLSLSNLLSIIPEIQPMINSLPTTVKDILNAKITRLVFKASTKELLLSLGLDTLTMVSQVIVIRNLKISLDVSLVTGQLLEIQDLHSQPLLPYRQERSLVDNTWFNGPTAAADVFDQWFEAPTAATQEHKFDSPPAGVSALELWFAGPSAASLEHMEQSFERPTAAAAPNVQWWSAGPTASFEQNFESPTSAANALEQWLESPTAASVYQGWTESPFATSKVASDQAVSINTMAITATWDIRGISIDTNIMYDKQAKMFNMNGVANAGQGVSIADIIKAFTTATIPVPSVLSSLKLINVVAAISDIETTVVLTATTTGGNVNANVYLLFQKKRTTTATAIAAEIQSFRVVDLVKTAANIDLTGVPFISSFVVSTMAISASTNVITTPLAANTFTPNGPLQKYGGTLPKGVTAHFEVQIGGKTGIAVSYEANKLMFVPPPKVGLSLSDLLSEMPAAISSVVNSLPSPLSDLQTATISAIDFDAATKTLSAAGAIAKLTIIPNKMEVTNIQASFVAILSSQNGGLQNLDFSANWVLGATTIRVKVAYDKATKVVVFAAMPEQGLDIQQLITSLTGATIALPSAINTAKLIKIVGRKTATDSTLIFSGTVGSNAVVHLVFKVMGQTSHIGIAAGISSFTFSDLVKSAVKLDISSIPFFGTVSVPSMALAITNEQITTALLTEVVAQTSPLVMYGGTLPKGFTAKFDAPPIGSVKGILGSFENKVLSFTVPPTVDASLGALVSVFSNTFDVNGIGVGPLFGDLLAVRLQSFTFDVQEKAMTMDLFLAQVTFYENILSIKDIKLKLFATFSPVSLSAEASATIALDGTDYAAAVGRDAVTKNYALSVSTPSLPLFGVITSLGASFLPNDLQIFLKEVFNFNIKDAKVVYPIAAQPPQIQLSGSPQLFGQSTAKLTAVAFKYSGKIVMIQKYDFPSFNIADLLKNLLNIDLRALKFLDQTVDLNFVVSPLNIKGVQLSVPDFAGFSLAEGISLKAPLPWPAGCSSDAFCNVAKNLFGKLNLKLEATITNLRSYSLTATVGDLELGGGVVLLEAGLQFEGGVTPSVGVVGNIVVNDQVKLQAAIRVTLGGVELAGTMTGCWNKAFGWDALTICDFLLSMTIIPTPLPLSGLQFGGRVEVGKKLCGQVLTAQGYVGINIIAPTENYFYADVGPVTFQKFFDAFCLSVTLPQPLADSGFPNGFKTSFSLGGVTLPHAGITIPSGYTFRGTFNFLGLETYINLRLQVTGIIADVNFPPLKIGRGILSMYRSSKDKTAGPFLHVELITGKTPILAASGFVQVFEISLETKLLISSTKYDLEISGKFLGLFEAKLHISAQYSKSITSGSFLVEGWFKSDLFTRIVDAVKNGLSSAAKDASDNIGAEQAKVNEAKAKLNSAKAALDKAQNEVDKAQREFDKASAEISSAEKKVDSVCSYKTCRKGKSCDA